ncbi:MAG: lamin tail domain-containing protein [Deltaproteobacteria bacterium]|nr:lamin tail domain-containing protein [Deltaproteobacteria bacterium]
MYSLRLSSIFGLVALLLVGSTGCPKDPPVTQPDIVSFASDVTTITGAGTATLSWQTTGAESVSMVDGADQAVDLAGAPAAAGSVDVTLDTVGSHTFTLTATGEEGSTPATASVTLTVEAYPAPQVTAFAAAPASILAGATSTLSWTTTDADAVSMVDDAGNTIDLTGQAAAAGTVDVTPAADTTYTLTATGPGGTATSTATVTVLIVPSILTFTSDATGPIVAGAPVVLSWTTTDTDSLALADDAGNTVDVSGLAVAGDSVTVNPGVSATYTLTATNTNGDTTATVSIDVLTAIASFTLTPSTARAGDTVTLDWQMGGATGADITGPDGFTYTVPAGDLAMGSTTATAGSPGDFVLSATGPLNNDSWTETLAITTAPRIRTFTATPAAITEGESATLAWTVDGATTLDLTDSLGNTIDISALSVSADSIAQLLVAPGTVTYTLTATNVDGNHVMTADVVVEAIPTIDAFAALPTRVASGADSTLSWMTTDAASVRLEENTVDLGIPANDLTASYTAMGLTADSTYVLYAANSLGYEVMSAPLTVTVGAPVNVSFVANPPAGAPSDTIALQWVNDGGTTVTVNDGTTDVCVVNVLADVAAGSCNITAPAAIGTYTYTLTVADGAGGSDTATTDLFVSDGPIIRDFSGSAGTISEGDALTLSWTVDNDPAGTTPTLTLTDDQGNTYDISALNQNLDSGDVVGLTAGTYVFTLSATTGAGTDAVATVTVTVIPLPTIVTFDANPRSLDTQGGTVVPTTDISWTTTGGVSAELWALDATGAPIAPAVYTAANQGEVDAYTLTGHSLTTTTVFQLHVENSVGGFVESVITVVVDGPVIDSFVATLNSNPVTEIVAGETVDLTWTTQRADAAQLDPTPIVFSTGGFTDISTTGTLLAFNDDDFGEAGLTFPAGFTFPYYGTDRTECVVTTDGFISFDIAATSTGVDDPFPSTTTPNGGVIAAFWDDLDLNARGAGWYELIPDAVGPDRLIIQWKNEFWSSSALPADLNFQIVLWDNGDFAVHYGTMTSSDQPRADGDLGSIGFEDDTGTRGVQINRNTAWPGGLSNVSWSVPATVPTSGTVQVSPMTDSTYTLTATSTLGSASDAVTLIVHPAAQITGSGFTPALPQEGETFDVTWTTSDATQVVVTDAGGNVRCTVTTPADVASGACALSEATPATYDYTVTATGALPRDTTSVTVSVQVWPTLTISSWTATDGTNTDPDELFVTGGTSVDLVWDTTGAVGFAIVATPGGNITPAGWGATGTLTLTPAVTTTYTLSISDDAAFSAGSRQLAETVTVYVDAAQVTSFGASATQSAAGANVDLSWTTSGTIDELAINPESVITTFGNTFTSIVGLPSAVDITPTSFTTGYTTINLPTFSFPFDGSTFSSFRIDSNGVILFDTSTTSSFTTNDPIPSTTTPAGGLIAPFWDYTTGTAGTTTLRYLLSGIPGSQQLIIEWNQFALSSYAGTLTFQAILYENGNFEFNYIDMTASSATNQPRYNGLWATTGFENIAEDGGYELNYNTESPNLIGNGIRHFFNMAPLAANGTTTVAPQQTTTYEICATGGGYTDCKTVTVVVVEPGHLLITELMVNPDLVADVDGEWFEIVNTSVNDIDLQGFVLTDGEDTFTIPTGTPIMIAAGGTFVFGRSADTGVNGGFTVDLAYGAGAPNLLLDDVADDLTILSNGVIIDTVAYDTAAGWMIAADTSITLDSSYQLAGDGTQNDVYDNAGTPVWCQSMGTYGSLGLLGSPGTVGTGCRYPWDMLVNNPTAPGWIDISATGTPIPVLADSADYQYTPGIGFDFPFFGTTVTELWITSNGIINFADPLNSQTTNDNMPSTTSPQGGTVAAVWDDLEHQGDGTSGCWVETRGTVGNQVTIVTWHRFRYWTGVDGILTFQVQLYEATGDIVVIVQEATAVTDPNGYHTGSSATIAGVENDAGTEGLQYSYNTAGSLYSGLNVWFRAH